MDNVLCGLQGTELFVYLDDIVIYARTLEEHRSKFNKLARRLREANLKLQPSKCGFLFKEVAYLGHLISEDGVKPCPKKIVAVQNFPKPKSARNVREFLGLAGYYRRFIGEFAQISKPLTRLLNKDSKFVWGSDQEEAFKTLRSALCDDPVLQYPDFSKPFNVACDASGYALGAVLSQGELGKDRPIAYASRLLHGAETNYSTIEKECLAIIFAVQYFRPYIYGREFRLITDHRPLVWMNSVQDPTSRLLRWRLKLAEFEYQIIYKPGKANSHADALSRNPVTLPLSARKANKKHVPPPLRWQTRFSSDSADSNAPEPLPANPTPPSMPCPRNARTTPFTNFLSPPIPHPRISKSPRTSSTPSIPIPSPGILSPLPQSSPSTTDPPPPLETGCESSENELIPHNNPQATVRQRTLITWHAS